MKTVILVQGHPEFSRGGAETAAYNLHKGLLEAGGDSVFLAQHDARASKSASDAVEAHVADREYFWYTRAPFNDLNSVDNSAPEFSNLINFLRKVDPDVIHFHHYFRLGSELYRLIRKKLPNVKIVLTLHEFLAICGRDGQMMKTSGSLCFQPSRQACTKCLGWSSSRYHIRDDFYRKMFSHVDVFVSPSEFLKSRYVDWGLDPRRIKVIENAQRENDAEIPKLRSGTRQGLVLGFFGQINPYKGLHVLLEAIDLLPKKIQSQVRLNIYGANLAYQEESFRKRIEDLIRQRQGQVVMRGSYEPEQLSILFGEIDAMVIPSVWWENSPMVIQEAFSNKVPVIASGIGGMKEKVIDGVNGLYSSPGDPASLAEKITMLVKDDSLLDSLIAGIQPPLGLGDIGRIHMADVYAGETNHP